MPARRAALERDSLDDLEAAFGALSVHADANPMAWIDWTHAQMEFRALAGANNISLFRAGNQVGKTHVGAALTIEACLRKSIEAWVVCTSWSQAVAIMQKVWDLVPKGEIAKGQLFSRRRGFGKDNPALEFANGSIIRFRTTNQGAEALAGATVDWIWIDEPTDEEIYRELQKRISRKGGRMIITLTPVNRDCTWLRRLVEAGAIPEVHARLDDRSLTFARTGERMRLPSGRVLDAAWIAQQEAVTPEAWRDVVLHGGWEMRVEGVFFKPFDVARHVTNTPLPWAPSPVPAPRWTLGIDYSSAEREFGQCVSLCRWQTTADSTGWVDRVRIADEVVLDGSATNAELARSIMAMLARHGLRWRDVSEAWGDLPVTTARSERSNLETMRHLARETGVGQLTALLPRIGSVKEGAGAGAGSRSTGCRYLYELLALGRVTIDPRCTHLIKALQVWDYSDNHAYKDGIDSVRYSLRALIFRPSAETPMRVRFAS